MSAIQAYCDAVFDNFDALQDCIDSDVQTGGITTEELIDRRLFPGDEDALMSQWDAAVIEMHASGMLAMMHPQLARIRTLHSESVQAAQRFVDKPPPQRRPPVLPLQELIDAANAISLWLGPILVLPASDVQEGRGTPGGTVELLLDENARKIATIAGRNQSAAEKMQAIVLLDRTWAGRDSAEWGKLLGVSSAAIRQCPTWKLMQKRHPDD